MALNEIMSIMEVADYLKTTESKVRQWVENGEIPCVKLGSEWRFRRSDIDELLKRRVSSQSAQARRSPISVGDVLDRDRVRFLEGQTKKEALEELIDLLAETPQVTDREDLARGIFHREELMSTGIGLGMAVPHVRLPSVKGLIMAVGIAKRPILDYQSLDGEPVRAVFMIAASQRQHEEYLGLLSYISSLWKDEKVRQAVLDAEDAQEAYELLIKKGST